MMIQVEDLIEELEDKKANYMAGICIHGKSLEDTEFERGKFTELKRIIDGLRERAADTSR